MNIKPIETIYKGYKFRSRLEARWAVFFDAAGIKYEYEPEGFDLGNGIYYLPDFYLPEVELRNKKKGLWVEVKGVLNDDDKKKIGLFSGELTWDGKRLVNTYEQQGIAGGIGYNPEVCSNNPIVCVGAIPHGFNGSWPWHNEDEDFFWTFNHVDGDWYWLDFYKRKDGSVCVCGPDNDYMMDDGWHGFEKLNDAYIKARQARFEHGEAPIVEVQEPSYYDFGYAKEKELNSRIMELRFCIENKQNDMAVGGRLNLTDIKIARSKYFEWLKENGLFDFEVEDYFRVTTITNFFRDNRIRHVFELKAAGADPYKIAELTKLRWEWIKKYYFDKDKAEKVLNGNDYTEEFYYAKTKQLR